jgi:hypothetical protein
MDPAVIWVPRVTKVGPQFNTNTNGHKKASNSNKTKYLNFNQINSNIILVEIDAWIIVCKLYT